MRSKGIVRYVSKLDTNRVWPAPLGPAGPIGPVCAGRDLRHPGPDRRRGLAGCCCHCGPVYGECCDGFVYVRRNKENGSN